MPASTFLMLRAEVRLLMPTIVFDPLTRFCRKPLLGET